jgi:hypothetical protein
MDLHLLSTLGLITWKLLSTRAPAPSIIYKSKVSKRRVYILKTLPGAAAGVVLA